jgi:hypothetical protein
MNSILTRKEKRQLERAKEKHVENLMAGGMTNFQDVTHLEHTQKVMANVGIKPERVFVNGLFVVQVFPWKCAWGNCKRVMIRWNDARPLHDWTMFQKIKTEIFGPGAVALEVYPKESNKQDVANVYWLFVLPKGFDCPIEWKRKKESKAKMFIQRNWRVTLLAASFGAAFAALLEAVT